MTTHAPADDRVIGLPEAWQAIKWNVPALLVMSIVLLAAAVRGLGGVRQGQVGARSGAGHHGVLLCVQDDLATESVPVVVLQGVLIVQPIVVRATQEGAGHHGRGGGVQVDHEHVRAVGLLEPVSRVEVHGGATDEGGLEAACGGREVRRSGVPEDVQLVGRVHHHAVWGFAG